MSARELLERERTIATERSYEYMRKIREGGHSRNKTRQLEEHRNYYQTAEVVISRLLELLANEQEGEGKR